MPSDAQVEAAAAIIAKSPLIDSPKLPPECWYGLARAALEAAALDAQGAQWQPIETAPKDGTEIDLWARRDETDRYERVTDCSWELMSDWDGREHEGWSGLCRSFHRTYVDPTHWMLPPAAPQPSTGR